MIQTLYNFNKFYTTTDRYPIKNFTIYGERHSGTNWLQKLISNTFNIPITWEYDHKHFFGCCDWNKLNNANNTLFIGITRNIYNWIRAMRKTPYHLHTQDILSISPWISTMGISEYSSFCDSHWYTKQKYTDVFDMRKHKIEFINLYMPYLVDNYVFIRYEDLIDNTKQIIEIISDMYKIPIIDINNKYIKSDNSKTKISKLSHNYFNTINLKTYWEIENMIGYQKITEQEQTNYRIFEE